MLTELKMRLQEKLTDPQQVILFATTSSGQERGKTVHTLPEPFEAAFAKIEAHLAGVPSAEKRYLRVDLVTKIEKRPYAEGAAEIAAVERTNYFRQGVSFYEDFRVAFLPEEIQGNALLRPVKDHQLGVNGARMFLSKQNISGYLTRMTGKKIEFVPRHYPNLWFFDTQGFFYEDGQWLTLTSEGLNVGLRQIASRELLASLPESIQAGQRFLLSLLKADGSFTYGYYPAYDYNLSGYNSIRHLSSLYALLECEESFPTAEGLAKIKQGIQWAFANLSKEVADCLLIIERFGDPEWPRKGLPPKTFRVKLGAQAMALLCLSKYMAITGSQEYVPQVQAITRGMERYFVSETGDTTHILNEHLEVYKKFEIVYYDGEAVFGLLRAYGVTKEPQLLALAEKLFQRLIDKGYQQYHDHWLSYATNEILLYRNEPQYYEFGLRNALDNLTFIEERDTAYPTMLELLMAAVKMTDKMMAQPFVKELSATPQDVARLKAVAEKRALHEVNTATMFPELAMFFKAPEKIVGGFMTRHDKFRMRIDDEEHYLSGLVNYFNYFHQHTDQG